MTRVFYASTLFGAMSLARAIGRGALRRGRAQGLVVSTNTLVPEVCHAAGPDAALRRAALPLRRVRSWNELIAPLHPSDWRRASSR
ncbi:hypothetical protein [Nonomuraea dietziae]|uniref:hypothetical protein n=1 Tax=Nonomuraea dietziae TaxID=65515 RepID=UPI0031CE00E7